MKIAIVAGMFNERIVQSLIEGATLCYKEQFGNVDDDCITYHVPGAFEIPSFVNQLLLKDAKFDAVITLGCVIKGETAHFEYISESVTNAIMKLSVNNSKNIPILFGVLTTYNKEQALERSRVNDKTNKGYKVMNAAIKMVNTINKLT